MSKKTLKFDHVEVNKKEFHTCKQPIALDLGNVDKILISDKFRYNETGFKYFISYKNLNVIRPLCIILPQISGFIRYFDNGGKNISLMIEDDSILFKYSNVWHKIRDEKYIKAKVKELNDVVNTNFLKNEVPKEGVHYTFTASISIDSVAKMNKKIIHKFI